MIIDVKQKENSWGRIIVIQCDNCNCLFEKVYQTHVLEKKHHFCSRTCMGNAKKSGGVLQVAFEEKYGVSNNYARKEIKEKIVETFTTKYGEGIINPSQIEEYRNKAIETLIKNYGVDIPIKNIDVQNRMKHTMQERYGHEYVSQCQEFKEKIKETNFERYGYEFSLQNPVIREKAFNKRLETKTSFVSKMEQKFVSRLETILINDVIETQIKRSKWILDVYLPQRELFIQYDGNHYHGINEKSRAYSRVQKQMLRDAEQNEWFKNNNINLLRISSKLASHITDEQLIDLINNTSGVKIHYTDTL